MIIKRWNGSAFVKEFPQTQAQLIRNAADNQNIFDSNDKLRPTYLPDVAFDGLRFYAATTGNVAASSPRILLASILIAAKDEVVAAGNTIQALKGYYFVINAGGTITGLTGIQDTLTSQEYATLQFRPQDGGSANTVNTSSGVLEVGDWFVIETVTGTGGVSDPWIFTASVINNAYELATTSIDGIVRLSSRTTYAGLTGNDAVTEGVLKTVIDNAAFAAGSHTHGNISNAGVVTTNTAAGTGQHLVITNASTNAIEQSAITLGTTTTQFLSNAGTWLTPAGTYAHPTQTAINANATDDGINVIDSVTVNTLGHVTAVGTRNLSAATTSAPGHMSAADKTKLDGIASGANAYVHPNHSGDVTSAGDGATTIANDVVTNAKLANMTNNTIKGRVSAGTGDPEDLTASQVRTLINVADGANNYVHPTYTYNTPTASTVTTLSDIQLISTLSQTNGHVTGGTARKLVAGSNVSITAASDGNITIASTDTNTTYSAGEGLTLGGTTFRMTNPLYVQTATPTTTVTGTIWYDIN
jgi:hypothetical protein